MRPYLWLAGCKLANTEALNVNTNKSLVFVEKNNLYIKHMG